MPVSAKHRRVIARVELGMAGRLEAGFDASYRAVHGILSKGLRLATRFEEADATFDSRAEAH
jgi:hypothetical protein